MDGSCTIRNNSAENGGAIYLTQSKVNVLGRVQLKNSSATANGGGIYLYQSELNCQKESTLEFIGNKASKKGGGLHAISSLIQVNFNSSTTRYIGSSVYFIENRAMQGGGVSLEMTSYIYILRDDTRFLSYSDGPLYIVNFIENQADLGGAMYVADDTNPATCARVLNKTHLTTTKCFLQTLALRGKSTVKLLNIKFVRNQANVSGDSLFGGLLDRCTVSPFGETYEEHIFHTEYKHLASLSNGVAYLSLVSNIQDFQQISSGPIQLHFCRGNEPDPTYRGPTNISIKAGETFSISVAAIVTQLKQ